MDDGIKRKLVGAGALVVVGLLVLPLLSPQTRNAQHLKQSVPPMPEAPDMTMHPPKAISIAVSDLVNPSADEVKPETVQVAAVKVDDETLPASKFELPVKNETGQALSWQIQVASFAESANAVKLRDELRKQGYQAYEQLAKDGVHTRVFVGPSYQKAALEKQAKQIAKSHKLTPRIIPVQPR